MGVHSGAGSIVFDKSGLFRRCRKQELEGAENVFFIPLTFLRVPFACRGRRKECGFAEIVALSLTCQLEAKISWVFWEMNVADLFSEKTKFFFFGRKVLRKKGSC